MPHRKSSWKQEWRDFASQEPGRRFRDRHKRRNASTAGRAWWRKALNLAGGLVLFAIGAFFAIAPGPAVVFFVVGGLLIANESYVAARSLDWIDVLIAPLLQWIQRHWRRLSPVARRVATGCMIGCSVLSMIVGFFVMR